MNRTKYLDVKYMPRDDTMRDFYDSIKFKKAGDAYNSHLHYLKNGFPEKLPENSVYPLQQQQPDNFEVYLPDQQNKIYDFSANKVSYQVPTSHYVPDFKTPPQSMQLQKFQNSMPQFNQFNQFSNQNGFKFDNNFSNAFNNQLSGFGANANGFGL